MPHQKNNIRVPSRANSLIDSLKATARHFSIGELELQPLSEQHYLKTLDIKQQLSIFKQKANEYKINIKENNKEIISKLMEDILNFTETLYKDIEELDCDGSRDRLDAMESIVNPYKLTLDDLIHVASVNNHAFANKLREAERILMATREKKRIEVLNQTQFQWVKEQLESKTSSSKLKLLLFAFMLIAIIAVIVSYLYFYKQISFGASVKPHHKKILEKPIPLTPIKQKQH